MRRLTWAAGVLAVLWCGYWAAGTYAIRSGAAAALQEAARHGTLETVPQIAMAGFPTAFDVQLQPMDLRNPSSGLRWQSPSLRLHAALWQPWRIVASLADDHVLTLPDQQLAIVASEPRASLSVTPNARAALSQVTATLADAVIRSSQGWQFAAAKVAFDTTLQAEPAHTYRITLDATDLQPDPVLMARTGLADSLQTVRLEALATLSGPLDRTSGETPPALEQLHLLQAQVLWGTVQLTAAGTITPDAEGLAEGRIDISITDWRLLVAALVGVGVITADAAPTVEGLLGAFAAQDGTPDVLTMPVVFAGGRASLGPLPLGPAPRLRPAFAG
jgi:hypothetical protein